MSNIREVARLAEVSVATVSRALQQPELVSVKTRNKVLAAVKQAGYQPNLLAVKFRSGKSHNLVVLRMGVSFEKDQAREQVFEAVADLIEQG